jgi:hypothetical protein
MDFKDRSIFIQILGSTEELLFCNYDLISKDWIRKQTISSLIPIYTGLVPKDQIDLFEKWITHAVQKENVISRPHRSNRTIF